MIVRALFEQSFPHSAHEEFLMVLQCQLNVINRHHDMVNLGAQIGYGFKHDPFEICVAHHIFPEGRKKQTITSTRFSSCALTAAT